MSQLSEPTMEFGLSFLKQMNSQPTPTNVLVSPLSIILVYGMLMEGAVGLTQQQILKTLCLDKTDGQTSDIPVIVKQLIENYKPNQSNTSDPKCTLEIANLLMLHNKLKVKSNYTQNILTNYLANVLSEDFEKGHSVKEKVNKWVAERTHNKIGSVMKEPPSSADIMILVNTIYFEGEWLKQFDSNETTEMTFNNADGTKIETKMMNFPETEFNYSSLTDKKLKIVEIPYVKNFSMILIMPTGDNNLNKLMSNLNSTELTSLLSSMKPTKLDRLCIPKFKLEDNHDLHDILPNMGMDLPFDRTQSDIPNIIEGSEPVYVTKSIQKALIEVSEKGTIAAAVTSTFIAFATSLHYNPPTFIADRPFLFIIRDNSAGINIFMGQLNSITPKQFL